MGKHNKGGGGGPGNKFGKTGSRAGGGSVGSVSSQGIGKKAPLPSTAVKKAKFSGLSVLERGTSEYRGSSKQEDRKRLIKEEKKKRALQRLLQEQGPPSKIFQELTQEKGDDDDDDSESVSSGGLSDEEVASGLITFKDPEVQRQWSPSPENGGKKGGQGKQKKNAGKEDKGKGGGKAAMVSMEVPAWEDGPQDEDEEEEEEEETRGGGGKGKGAGKAKKEKGDGEGDGAKRGREGAEAGKKKGLLDVLSQKANAKKAKLQEEREREREEKEKAIQGRLAYFAKRKKDRAMHMKKTAKGQPVLKNVISGILSKLQAE